MSRYRAQKLLQLVATETGVSVEEMKSPSRDRDLALARCLFWHLVDETCDVSGAAAARMLNRDHTTAMHGRSKPIPRSAERYGMLVKVAMGIPEGPDEKELRVAVQ